MIYYWDADVFSEWFNEYVISFEGGQICFLVNGKIEFFNEKFYVDSEESTPWVRL